MRLAVIGVAGGGSEIVACDMHTLLDIGPLADAFNGVLESLTAGVAER